MLVDGILADTTEQHKTFLEVKDKPHVLDDAIVDRAARAYRVQIDDLWLYEEQFARWKKEPLIDEQRQEVNRLAEQIPRIKELSEAILTLLEEIRAGTIDRIMEKSDFELGLEFLLGKHQRKP
jgi:hypothetical protein